MAMDLRMDEAFTKPRLAHLGLGSNLGDRRKHLRTALRLLHDTEQTQVLARAEVFETAPMYMHDQPPFLNTCAAIRTRLSPRALLRRCQQIEAALGRVRDIRNGPRTVDVDLLLIEDVICDDADLIIPHPRMLERAFVLVPLAQIAPDAIHPRTGRTISEEKDRAQDGDPEKPVDNERDVAQQ